MLKRAMNNNKSKFYILFYMLYIAQLTQCKVAPRRDDGGDANAKQANLVASELSDDSPDTSDSKDSAPSNDSPNAIQASRLAYKAEGKDKEEENDGDHSDDSGSKDDDDNDNDGNDEVAETAKDAASPPAPGPNGTIEKSEMKSSNLDQQSKSCWVSFGEKNFYQKMNVIDDKYKDAREEYAKEVDTNHFDKRILEAMKQTRGAAERTLQKFRGDPNIIPAGLNLGSYCMMRMPGSMLFFYRMKLRNDTRFVVNYIHNDVDQLTMTMRLGLNDLHLIGQYDRALTSKEDPSRLYYRPNRGEVEFLLKNVKYKVEGRYRLLEDRLHIEHIISEIPPMDILMRYATDVSGGGIPLQHEVLKEYLDRMQNDLDLWLKDYFNDFLMIYGFEEAKKNQKIQNYENERTMVLNEYADKVIDILNDRMGKSGGQFLMPDFVLTAANGMEIKLYDGTVRGVDSMYRRSVATGKRDLQVRFLDADIGFSGLKAEYRYDTYVKTGIPPVSGVFVLNAEDIYAHMALQITDPQTASTVDVQVTFERHGKPESLTIEGPANRIVANFNHLLEHHIITIMSSMLVYNIKSISSLTKCDPGINDLPNHNDEQKNEPTEPSGNKDDDGPVTPENNDDVPTPPDDDDDVPTAAPDNNDDGPTPPNVDDDVPTPPDDDDDVPTPASDDDNDVPTPPDDDDDDPTPAPDDDDDVPTPAPDDDNDISTPPDDDDDDPTPAPDDDDDVPTPAPDNDDDDPTPPDDDHDDPVPPDNQDDDGNKLKPDFGFARKESIEIELPPGSPVGGSYKIDHNDTFTMTRLLEGGDKPALKKNYIGVFNPKVPIGIVERKKK